ncbi:MAG: isoprenylcysteine carboxylmethyltransferase family protein [Pseudomonadota bacterium]
MDVGVIVFLGVLIAQRLSELVIAHRNTARLLQRGAYEVGAEHYPYMVALHSLWIAGLAIFGAEAQLHWGWLAIYAVLQGFRIWILTSLGERWTTRIIVLDEPLVVKGPFRFVRHPNYVLVVLEIAVVPLVLGLVWVAVLFSVLNAAMLFVRIRAEDRALEHLSA